MKTLYHECYFGFGDNIYERPFVVAMAKDYDRVYVKTPFPQLYWDQDPEKFFFLPRHSRLRTQEASIRSFKGWSKELDSALITKRSCFWLEAVASPRTPFLDLFRKESGIKEVAFNLPLAAQWKWDAQHFIDSLQLEKDRAWCLVKRPTIRTEWYCPSRNPLLGYFEDALIGLKQRGWSIILIGSDTDQGEYWAGPSDPILRLSDVTVQAPLTTILAVVAQAHLALSCPSFMIPATLALQTPSFYIFGGYIRPEHFGIRELAGPFTDYAAPEPFCDCHRMQHECNKTIADFGERFTHYLDQLEAHL